MARRHEPPSRLRVLAHRAPAFVIALIALATVLWPQRAEAINQLVSSVPASGATIDASPSTLQLTFRDPLGPNQVIVLACSGSNVPVGSPQIGADGVTATVSVSEPLPAGSCTVAWKASQPDGSPNGAGRFEFTVAANAAPPTTAPTVVVPENPDVPSAPSSVATPPVDAGTPGDAATTGDVGAPLGLARIATALGLAGLFGAVVLIVMVWNEGVEYHETARFLRIAAVVAIAGSLFGVICLTAAATGDGIGGSLSPATWKVLKDSTPGIAAIVRLVAAIGCAWVVWRPERLLEPGALLSGLGLPLLAVVTLGFDRWGGNAAPVGALLGAVHAVSMAVWLGGLLLLVKVVLAAPGGEDLVHAVRGFARISGLALAATVITGVAQMVRLDGSSILSSSHGRVALLKTVVVAGMVVVGLAARSYIRTRVSRAEVMSAPLVNRLSRPLGIEMSIGVVVIVLTAWMMSFTPVGSVTAPRQLSDLGPRHEIVNEANNVRASVRFTETVGANAVLVSIQSPRSGLQGVELEFVPPVDTGGTGVLLEVPLTGAGSALLDRSANMPLDVPGTWTVVLRINNVVIGSVAVNVQTQVVAAPTPGAAAPASTVISAAGT